MAAALGFRARLEEYQSEAEALSAALNARESDALWRVKWMHPSFRGKSLAEVISTTLVLADAQAVIAQEYGFDNWTALEAFAEAVRSDGPVTLFESAVEAVVSGDVATLRALLKEHPDLVRVRSARRHHATMLHYVAANGVEGARQRTPLNAVDVAKVLLDAGAEVDALADMYDAKCTTMSMLVSSGHPAKAGLQDALVATLVEYGAALEGPGSNWQSALLTALAFGYLATAETIARLGAPIDNLAAAAGLGRLAETRRLLPGADVLGRHVALTLAAQLGHADTVRLLLDAGEDPNRYNPDGYHSHSTPLHQAVSSGHLQVVRLLVDHGARLDIQDTIYQGTPLDWANYCGRAAIAEYLRGRGGPSQ